MYSKISMKVALLKALDGVTFPKYDEPNCQIILTCSSLTPFRWPCPASFRTFLIVIYFRLSKYNTNKYVIQLSVFVSSFVSYWRVLLFSRRILLRSLSLEVSFGDTDQAITMAAARPETPVLSQALAKEMEIVQYDLDRMYSSSLLSILSSSSSSWRHHFWIDTYN